MDTIDSSQLALLEKFSTKRVDSSNSQRILELQCERNPRIVAFLKNTGLKDNESGRIAMYMILGPNNELCMVFTLYCNMLFLPEELDADQSFIINQYQNGKLTHEEATNEIEGWDESKWVVSDTLTSTNPEVVYARTSFPAIELVHICNNDGCKGLWESLGLPNRMGETLFWYRIVPLLQNINSQVGFDYLCLYAADNKRIKKVNGGKLIEHYEKCFGFYQNDKIGIIKPHYDSKCTFMVQAYPDLVQNRGIFFNTFNASSRLFVRRGGDESRNEME